MVRPDGHLVPEIQGLRAVAVLAVLVYHVWPAVLPGGYVGVDVFFVISGYLITGSLFKEFERTGGISIAGFYARRIRRLLPAATLVSLAVAVAIPVFPRDQWADIATSLVASALYVQNWFLAAQAVDYLADDAKGPMNHFWSLSVEEQYYIVWPLILLPLLHLARRTSLSPRRAFGGFVGLIGLGSLAYSIWLTPLDPGTAYFATTTRAWELALGGALAVFQIGQGLSRPARVSLGFAGLGAILLACLAYSDETSFPGYAAALPTLGAAAVILARGAPSSWSAGWILNSRVFQYFGDISYSLYLWHWPLIVLYGQVTGRAIGPRSGVALLVASLGLAHLSKIWVEDRFRTGERAIARTFMAGLAGIAVSVVAGAGYLVREALEPVDIVANGASRGALAMLDPKYDWRDEDLTKVVPKLEKVRRDASSIYARKCHQNQTGTEVLVCDAGNPRSRTKIVIIGDSHAGHFYPAFEKLAETKSIYFRSLSKSACLFSLEAVYHQPFKRLYSECLAWSKNVIDWVERERPDIVLIAQTQAYAPQAVEGMVAAWKRLIDLGVDVRAIRSTPWLPFEAGRCLASSANWVEECSPLKNSVFPPDPVSIAAEALNLKVLDLTDYLCSGEYCPIIIGGVVAYRDNNHLTATFARTLSSVMGKELMFSKN